MGIKQKIIFDAGIAGSYEQYEINDQSGRLTRTPKSPYAIIETVGLAFTYAGKGNVVGSARGQFLSIADGERRPGTI